MYMVSQFGIEQGVIRLSDGAQIPAEPRNADWQVYLAWVDDDNEPLDYDENLMPQ